MRQWRSVVLFAAALVAAAGLAVAGTYAMTEDPPSEPVLPFDTPAECEQFQIDNRVWLPPEACDPSMFTGDNP